MEKKMEGGYKKARTMEEGKRDATLRSSLINEEAKQLAPQR